jgi:tetratricopeptide (TPR) repeat protein
MNVSIAEAMHQAQAALNVGDYRSASRTCSQLVSQFPGYALAHELLGEAYREQGQLADARAAFTAAFQRHQRHPGVYLGLGLLAEDDGETDHALAYCQVAWELAPERHQLRDPLMRVAMRRYGADGDLQFSLAALAQLHLNGTRLRRSVEAYRQALAELPERVDLRLGLAECLWRLGQDTEAETLVQGVLQQFPESAPALVVLADIEHRQGNRRSADDLLTRLRAVDPDGAIVAGMLAVNPHANREFLELHPSALPLVSDVPASVRADRPRIAPAPDFEYRPARADLPLPALEDLEPISVEEFGGSVDETVPISLEELGIRPDDLPSLEPAALPTDSVSPAGDDADFSFEGLEPITLEELGGAPEEAPVDDFAVHVAEEAGTRAEPLTSSLEAELGFEDFSEQPFRPDEAGAAPDFAGLYDAGFDELVSSHPVAPQDRAGWLPTASGAGSEDQRAGGDVDELAALAAALEGDVAQAISRAGEQAPVDDDLTASLPPDQTPSGYTTMLQSLGSAGLAPFDPRDRGVPGGADEDMPSLEMDDSLLEQARPDTDAADLGQITGDWDSIDDEILRAMPAGSERGYTAELQALNEIGLEPFTVEDAEEDGQGITPFNPFASDDRTVAPPRPPLPAPFPAAAFDEVVSHDAAPAHEPQHVAQASSEPDPLAAMETDSGTELPGELAPFAFEEFDTPGTTEPEQERRGISTWLTGGSAIPSDADLDALLAADEQIAASSAPTQVIGHETQEAEQTATQSESDLLKLVPGLTQQEIDPQIDQSLAVTRQLPVSERDGAYRADTHATADAPAPADWQDTQPTQELPPITHLSDEETTAEEDLLLRQSEPLRPGTEIFLRARQVKDEMVSEGIISGTRELRDGISTDDLLPFASAAEPAPTPDEDVSVPLEATPEGEDELFDMTGATRDVATLRSALEVTPDDDELRWWLAQALRERGEMHEAYAEYRWLIRHAPERQDDVLRTLHECVERDQAPEMAHRLLGDIYRRRGDVTRASNHAALALQTRRRVVGRR